MKNVSSSAYVHTYRLHSLPKKGSRSRRRRVIRDRGSRSSGPGIVYGARPRIHFTEQVETEIEVEVEVEVEVGVEVGVEVEVE